MSSSTPAFIVSLVLDIFIGRHDIMLPICLWRVWFNVAAGPMGPASAKRGCFSTLDFEINPHIPSWMASAPWYLDASAKPSLKHQRLRDGVQAGAAQSIGGEWCSFTPNIRTVFLFYSNITIRYSRGATLGPAATKFRKGACVNCGAMTHKTHECTERPRLKGAKCLNPPQLLVSSLHAPRLLSACQNSNNDALQAHEPEHGGGRGRAGRQSRLGRQA
jgi:hypothetical protein